MIPQRVSAFLKRHGANVPKMAMWAGLRTLYRRESVRRLVRPFLKPRSTKKWIFVVGCYNSGTTITQAILSAHPDVRTLPWEGSLITSVLPDPEDKGWTRMWIKCPEYMEMPEMVDPKHVNQLLRDWSPWWGKRGEQAFLEKSITNTTRMEWLDAALSPAYFIGMTRNGYCVSEGIRRKATPRPWIAKDFGDVYPLEMTARQWVVANQRLEQDAAKVERYHGLRYEDLMADPIRHLSEVWSFLELDPPAMTLEGDKLTIEGQVIRISNSMNEKSIGSLSPQELAEISPVISDMQEHLGYEVLS
ncbi:MAG: sulfotransferase [Planctomycetota bacterium]